MISNEDPRHYGRIWGHAYDKYDPLEAGSTVNSLVEAAGTGPVLELGVGTGRVAIPLSARGLEVYGLDASAEMIRMMRAKGLGQDVTAVRADMAGLPFAPSSFSLVYVVNNTFSHLLSQTRQLSCFKEVRAVLKPRGLFILEGYLPAVERSDLSGINVLYLDDKEVCLRVTRIDPSAQLIRSQVLSISEAGANLFPIVLRYVWPSELDLMAEVAGLRLKARWGGWGKEPFHSPNLRHISVYESPEGTSAA